MRVYSGATKGLLYTIWGEWIGAQFGAAVSQVHDLDGDDVRDFVVGAPYLSGGHVFAYSSRTGALLW
ncbi:MAG: integrin alpha, partial [Planctomycetota bacterium]